MHCTVKRFVGSQGNINAQVFLVQEGTADQGKQHTAPESSGFRKGKHYAFSFLAKQNVVKTIFHQAEPDWQSLLL